MKKVITIILTLLLLVGCSNDSSKKVVENYLESLKSMDYESTKTYMVNGKSFFSVENFADSVFEGYKRVNLKGTDEKSEELILSLAKKYIEKAVEKSMDFNYEIVEEVKTNSGVEVTVNLNVLDGEKFIESLENNESQLSTISTNSEEDIQSYFEDLNNKLDSCTVETTRTLKLKLVKVDGNYKIENGVEINDILIEPFSNFVEVFSR
ncbi:hypothetical protein SAMN02745245_01864 [Anaerosphaera aminiphila DSM 21120]|uniref:DUF5105 domain-containing protein n=1 Tax=Anaerosphaera aminiphila DSM 21120 TaxID=1120995 RepID=A0A1M5USM4_9FIRM|nr:hypothetical protein [Anaerosphaera aminiphila]SHH65934.1 hypothetical protein SAMN02745245_01864 [Anaerosphaera aminiphila DSM 21120]